MAFTFTWTGTALDEDVLSFEIQQSEGQFATLRVEIRNPRVGLLAPGAPLWGELSMDGALLFRGRLLGLPESLAEEVVTLSFVARPEDYETQRQALAASLKAGAYYDPIWYTPERREDPDIALEARPALWHVDRATHAVTVSDIIAGEAGVVTFGGGLVLEDSLQMQFRERPVSRIECRATVQWAESGAGTVDLGDRFKAVKTYTGLGLTEDWPAKGGRIGGGWFVSSGSASRKDGKGTQALVYSIKTEDGRSYGLPLWTVRGRLVVGYSVERDREESVAFTLTSDVQPVASDGDEEVLQLNLSSAEIDQPVDAGALPIRDLRNKSYFTTDRGRQSLEHLILLCRARLLARARAVAVSWQAPFDAVAALSLRHSAQVVDARLPGGQATGKVIGYRLTVNGDSGEALGEVTIACTIGRGGSIAPVVGPSDYADGYELGYAQNGSSYPVAGDVAWQWGAFTVADDGVNLKNITAKNSVLQLAFVNLAAEQETRLNAAELPDLQAALAILNEHYTEVALTLRPLTGGPFVTDIPVITSPLKIPRTIDLEA